MQDKQVLENLVELYVEVQNMFENLTPTKIQKYIKGQDEMSILEIRRNSISQRLVDMIDIENLQKTNLRVGASPFVADARTILKELNGE